ncbi:hypothetical protein RB213_005848 [Colletotrichum asianum]
MLSLNDMPPEILEHICSYLMIPNFHARPWKHRLVRSSIPELVISEEYDQKRLLSFARKNPILYLLLPTPPAVICGHLYAREQTLDALRTTNYTTAESHVRKCYIAVRYRVRKAAHLAGVTLPASLDADNIDSVVSNLVPARHPNIRELGLRGEARDLDQVGDLKRSDDGPLLPSLKSVFVKPLDEFELKEHSGTLGSSHITKLLNLGTKVTDIFIQNFWLRLTDDIASQHLTAITLRGVVSGANDIQKLLKNARGLRSFAYLAEIGDLFASDVIAELEEHCPALETLCLKFAHYQSHLGFASVGQRAPFSLRKFRHLRNIWIDNWSIINSIQEKPGPVTHPLNPQPHLWTSHWNEFFMSKLPESVERLHFHGCVYPCPDQLPVGQILSLTGALQDLAADHKSGNYPKLQEVAVEGTDEVELVRKALEDTGLRVLAKADKKPYLWF